MTAKVSGGRRETKRCVACGKTFAKPPKKTRAQWEAQRACSLQCVGAMRRGHVQEKPCKCCGKLMRRHVGESSTGFDKRQYCDRACAGKHRATLAGAPEWKECKRCGNRMTRRKGESLSRWAERKNCSRECGGAPVYEPSWLVPVEPIAREVESLVAKLSVDRVAKDLRVRPRRVTGIVRREFRNMDFRAADQILARLGLTHLWFTDPVLSKAYQEAA